MRARLAIARAQVRVELREIELRNKPESLLLASPKGTVPVLLLGNSEVIDESQDIMFWALRQHDPEHWLEKHWLNQAEQLIQWNDGEFKYYLDRYKYADRYPERTGLEYREQGKLFLTELERRLSQHLYLCGNHFSLADAAILPFIRQFAAVDTAWFETSPYPALKQWLNHFQSSRLFETVMTKYLPWQPDDPVLFFG
jgi:glutathione S-transferase